MMREMTAQQFDEWIAFYQLEPFGILAEDTISAHWKAIYYNMHRKRGMSSKKVKHMLTFQDDNGQADASALFEGNDEDDGSWLMSET